RRGIRRRCGGRSCRRARFGRRGGGLAGRGLGGTRFSARREIFRLVRDDPRGVGGERQIVERSLVERHVGWIPCTRARVARPRSYSASIRATSGSPSTSATSAASWATVGAVMIVYWWILRMPSTISAGAASQPIRQPVIAYAFEKPPIRIVRSRMPGSDENARWRYEPYASRS